MHWTGTPRVWSSIAGLDPVAEWIVNPARDNSEEPEAPGNTLFFRTTLIPSGLEASTDDLALPFILTPVEGGPSGADLMAMLDAAELGSTGQLFVFPDAERTALKSGGSACILASQTFFRMLVSATGGPEANGSSALVKFRDAAKSIRLSSSVRSPSVPAKTGDPLIGKMSSRPVLGVIDDGFGLAHRNFRDANGSTRIAMYWDQEADQDPASTLVPGREITGVQLNAVLQSVGGEEERFYAHPDLAPFFPLRRNHIPRALSHGTQVLDLAAGDATGVNDTRIIAVKLPRDSVLDTSGGHLDYFILRGVRYILANSAPDARVIVVVSYGYYGGPLDGASAIERELDRMIAAEKGRLQIVLAAGNARRERTRADVSFPNLGPESQALRWRVLPDDRTPSFMQIWMPVTADAAGLSVELVTPSGLASGPLRSDETGRKIELRADAPSGATQVVAQMIVDPMPLHGSNGTDRRVFTLSLRPTGREGLFPSNTAAGFALAPSGIWTVLLQVAAGAKVGDVRCFIGRDDSIVGFPVLGRQSTIDRGTAATEKGTISAIATGRETIVMGGYVLESGRAAPYSACGPVEAFPDNGNLHRSGPDALIPTEISQVAAGIMSAGFRSGARSPLPGTSAAAPLLARELLQVASGDRGWVHARAVADEALIGDGKTPGAAQGGSGRIRSTRTEVEILHRLGKRR